MKLPILSIILAVALSSAAVRKDTIYDTLTVKQTVIDTVHRVIADSVTSNAMIKSQELYNMSFSNIQNSFSNFLIAVSIITGILAIFIGTLVFINFRSVENSKKEMREIKEKFEKIDKRFESLKKDLKDNGEEKTYKVKDLLKALNIVD